MTSFLNYFISNDALKLKIINVALIGKKKWLIN
jgi:hypothetical protein